MAAKVNLKKYTAVDGAWRFVPVLKINGWPRPEAVVIGGATVRGTSGTYYVEWRQNGKRIPKPCGTSPREALDAWRAQVALLNGEIDEPEEEDSAALPLDIVSIQSAAYDFLESVKATKSPATHEVRPTIPTSIGSGRTYKEQPSAESRARTSSACSAPDAIRDRARRRSTARSWSAS